MGNLPVLAASSLLAFKAASIESNSAASDFRPQEHVNTSATLSTSHDVKVVPLTVQEIISQQYAVFHSAWAESPAVHAAGGEADRVDVVQHAAVPRQLPATSPGGRAAQVLVSDARGSQLYRVDSTTGDAESLSQAI